MVSAAPSALIQPPFVLFPPPVAGAGRRINPGGDQTGGAVAIQNTAFNGAGQTLRARARVEGANEEGGGEALQLRPQSGVALEVGSRRGEGSNKKCPRKTGGEWRSETREPSPGRVQRRVASDQQSGNVVACISINDPNAGSANNRTSVIVAGCLSGSGNEIK